MKCFKSPNINQVLIYIYVCIYYYFIYLFILPYYTLYVFSFPYQGLNLGTVVKVPSSNHLNPRESQNTVVLTNFIKGIYEVTYKSAFGLKILIFSMS